MINATRHYSSSVPDDNTTPADIIASGTCGENITWALDADQKLTITGSGEMYDYPSPNSNNDLWGRSIHEVIFKEGITSVGNNSFSYCRALSSVEFPSTIQKIGKDAFYYCDNLESVELPDAISVIGDDAFGQCGRLQSIHVSTGNMLFADEDGVLFNKEKTSLICYPNGRTEADYNVPESVTTIIKSAFYFCKAKNISLPDGITTIEDCAFAGCSMLKTINLPESLLSIGSSAFHLCKNLTEIDIPQDVSNLKYGTFMDCTSLNRVTIPDSVTSIASNAFENASSVNIFCGCNSDAYRFSVANSIPYTITHSWNEPTYLWNLENTLVTANRTCKCGENSETEEVQVTTDIVKQPTCMENGIVSYTSKAFSNQAFSIQTKPEVEIPALGHIWMDPVYTWSDDYQFVTASSTCERDNEHLISETAETTSVVTANPSCEITGETTYSSAEFQNDMFSVQTKTVANIPATGHNWGEPTYTWASDNSSVTITRICRNNNEHVETETLTASKMPADLEIIDEEAFYGNSAIGIIILPSKTHEIRARAFANSSLLAISIPNLDTVIAEDAFDNRRADFFMKGYPGSTAEEFAQTHNIEFVNLDTYEVQYNANGGFGAPTKQNKIPGIPLTLSNSIPEKSNTVTLNYGTGETETRTVTSYFDSWNTSKDGRGTRHDPNATYNDDVSIVLYAQWNDGLIGALPAPERNGFTFEGWYTAPSGGNRVTESTVVVGNMTIYAHWSALEYYIFYNLNGGTNDERNPSSYYCSGNAIKLYDPIDNDGYPGYWVDQDGQERSTIPANAYTNYVLSARYPTRKLTLGSWQCMTNNSQVRSSAGITDIKVRESGDTASLYIYYTATVHYSKNSLGGSIIIQYDIYDSNGSLVMSNHFSNSIFYTTSSYVKIINISQLPAGEYRIDFKGLNSVPS